MSQSHDYIIGEYAQKSPLHDALNTPGALPLRQQPIGCSEADSFYAFFPLLSTNQQLFFYSTKSDCRQLWNEWRGFAEAKEELRVRITENAPLSSNNTEGLYTNSQTKSLNLTHRLLLNYTPSFYSNGSS